MKSFRSKFTLIFLLELAALLLVGYGIFTTVKLDNTKTKTVSSLGTVSSAPSQSGSSNNSSPSTTTNPSTTPQTPSVVTSSSDNTTSNWAGYVATAGDYTSISGSWTVPQPSASSGTASDATWIGIGGVSSDDLIQAGTQNIVSSDGSVTTSAFYELLPDVSQPTSLTVNPGDQVTTTITETTTDVWQITITDNTTGDSFSTTVEYASSLSSAEWIEEDPSTTSSLIPLDNFGSVTFTGGSVSVNGTSESISAANSQAFNMANSDNQLLTTVSNGASDGSDFTVTRTSAASDTESAEGYGINSGGWTRRGQGIGRRFGSSSYFGPSE